MDLDLITLTSGFALGIAATLAARTKFMRKLAVVLRHAPSMAANPSQQLYKMVLVVRTDVAMTPGKIASQCCHATVSCYVATHQKSPDVVKKWEIMGQPKVVVKSNVPGEQGLRKIATQAENFGVTAILIKDAGRTQVPANTATVLGLGPADSRTLDQLSGHLKLL